MKRLLIDKNENLTGKLHKEPDMELLVIYSKELLKQKQLVEEALGSECDRKEIERLQGFNNAVDQSQNELDLVNINPNNKVAFPQITPIIESLLPPSEYVVQTKSLPILYKQGDYLLTDEGTGKHLFLLELKSSFKSVTDIFTSGYMKKIVATAEKTKRKHIVYNISVCRPRSEDMWNRYFQRNSISVDDFHAFKKYMKTKYSHTRWDYIYIPDALYGLSPKPSNVQEQEIVLNIRAKHIADKVMRYSRQGGVLAS